MRVGPVLDVGPSPGDLEKGLKFTTLFPKDGGKTIAHNDQAEHPAWLREQLEADEEERAEGQQAIRAHNKRIEQMTYTTDDLQDTLDEFLDTVQDAKALPAFRDEMSKAIQRLQDDVAYGYLDKQQVQRRVADLQDAVAQTYNDGLVTRRAVVKVANVVDRLCKGIRAMGEAHAQPSRHASVAALAKSALPAHASKNELLKAAQVLKGWFGPLGSKQVAYISDFCTKLRLTKSITSEQEDRWERTGRLPDWINVVDPSQNKRVEWQSDVQKSIGMLLSQVSPLYLASLTLR